MTLDHELRRALTRKDPPAEFDDRILRRLAAGETGTTPVARRPWQRFVLPIAASAVLVVGWSYYEQQQQRADAERAVREVTFALQISSEALADVQQKVQEMNQYEPSTQH